MQKVEEIPPALRAAVSRDLRPVKPLPKPQWRALPLLPVGMLLLTAAVFIFGLRRDAPQLGWRLTWIASTLQMLFGLVLAILALREAVPGTTLSQRTVRVAFAIAAFGVALVTWLTWLTSSAFTIAPGYGGFVWRVCVAGTVIGALPALAVSGWLVARAFPLRPHLAGALYGVGAGLMSDAGWRLFCHFSSPGHVFGAHILGIAICTVFGSVIAYLLRPRSRTTQRKT